MTAVFVVLMLALFVVVCGDATAGAGPRIECRFNSAGDGCCDTNTTNNYFLELALDCTVSGA